MLKSIGLLSYLPRLVGKDTLPMFTNVRPTDFSCALPAISAMRKFTLIFITLLTTFELFGTAQRPDILIYKGKKLEIFTNPLESYFNEGRSPMDLIKGGCMSTACWRGYVGIWKIIDDQLYLIELRSCCYEEDKIKGDLSEIFGDKYVNGKVHADWFSGELVIPKGKMLYYEHMGYASVYKKELNIKIDDGMITEIKKYDNSKTRITYLNSDKLTKFIIQNLDEKYLNSWNTDLKAYVDIKSTNGQVTSAEITTTNIPELSNELIRIVNKIDDWDILYRHGQEAELPWIYPIIINQDKIEKYSR